MSSLPGDVNTRSGAAPFIASSSASAVGSRVGSAKRLLRAMQRHWQLYLLIIPPMAYIVVFKYVTMFGAVLAFKNYNFMQGIWGSPWAGTTYFTQFFDNPDFWPLIRNTLTISLLTLAIGFPLPIILALALKEVGVRFSRFVQMVTFAPFFISTVVMASMIIKFLSPYNGISAGPVNTLLMQFGFHSTDLMGDANSFPWVYALAMAWQNMGYGAVVYIAALSGINPELYEAARVDGASRFRQIVHIDLPGIRPVIVILLVLAVGNIMNVGFEQVYLLQNSLNLPTSEIINTYVYKVGLLNANFSYSTAVGLFNAVVNFTLVIIVNFTAARLGDTSLF